MSPREPTTPERALTTAPVALPRYLTLGDEEARQVLRGVTE